MVDTISPPITTIPIGARQAPSPDSDRAVGTMPAVIATVVMTIGWARLWPASIIASNLGTPFCISSIAKSIRRIEFLLTIPRSMSTPISTGMDTGVFHAQTSSIPPSGASASEPILTSGDISRL